jgi:UDP:flavonoid glycosyltransferase YjiC (YdhE family)
MKLLLFPSDLGGGFGHISRCLAIAEESARRGWDVAFVLRGPHAGRVLAEGWKVFSPPAPVFSTRVRRWLKGVRGLLRSEIAYLFFSDLNFQAVRDGFSTPQAVQRQVDWELSIVNRFCPDILIGDAWLLASIVGRLAGLPVVQVIRSAAHPACPELVWWRDVPSQIRSPDITPVFNPALEQWGLPPIERAEDLLDGDLLVIPSIPELDPLPAAVERSHYIGPLTRLGASSTRTTEWLEALPSDCPIVYVTVGGGSDSVRGLDLLPFWEAAFSGTDWTVVVSTGGRPVPRRYERQGNLRVFSWVPGAAVIARADVVLFHGGYGTMMETVRFGVPSVVIPFHTEQESNGRRLQQSGAARVLAPAVVDLTEKTFHWEHSDFTALICRAFSFHPSDVKESVQAVLQNDSYKNSAACLQRSQSKYGGAPAAEKLIRDLVSF